MKKKLKCTKKKYRKFPLFGIILNKDDDRVKSFSTFISVSLSATSFELLTVPKADRDSGFVAFTVGMYVDILKTKKYYLREKKQENALLPKQVSVSLKMIYLRNLENNRKRWK